MKKYRKKIPTKKEKKRKKNENEKEHTDRKYSYLVDTFAGRGNATVKHSS